MANSYYPCQLLWKVIAVVKALPIQDSPCALPGVWTHRTVQSFDRTVHWFQVGCGKNPHMQDCHLITNQKTGVHKMTVILYFIGPNLVLTFASCQCLVSILFSKSNTPLRHEVRLFSSMHIWLSSLVLNPGRTSIPFGVLDNLFFYVLPVTWSMFIRLELNLPG